MFKKSFKQRSQVSLKSSEKKKFVAKLKTFFPALTDEDIAIINGLKESLIKIKVITIKDEIVEVYAFDKIPLVFDIVDAGIKLPTVFMCWKFPHVIPQISTENFVLNKLQNGADLFSPGVIIQGLLHNTEDFKANSGIYINLSKNKAAMAVGLALVSKEDILSSHSEHQSKKVVKIYHCVGDFLYKLHPEPTIPEMGLPDWTCQNISISGTDKPDETPKTNDHHESNEKEKETENGEKATDDGTPEKSCEASEKEKFNDVLEYCFLKAIKTVPKNAYPILPATFYANHVLTSLPKEAEFNIKKTKWKKFSLFLQEKSQLGLITLEPVQRGEFTIGKVQYDHKIIREFVDPNDDKQVVVEPVSTSDKPSMQEVFSVSAATVPFFSKMGFKKNDEMTRMSVRLQLNDYIKRENLILPDNMEKVRLDPVLYEILKGEEVISRADLLAKMLEKMSIRYKISSTPNVVHKGKMPLIDFDVLTRRTNKKVTVISNLESYGVNVVNFSKELKQKAAASTTIVNPVNVPYKNGPQVQVQGNQILIAADILKEKYNINEKYMRGLQKAPKPKKK